MLRSIGNQFRKPSGFWGRIISKLMAKGNDYAYDKIIADLDIKQNDKLFEIGYGPGFGVSKILSTYDCFISGIDFSELMFNEATRRNKKYIDDKKVELHYGDFLTKDVTANQYDKVFCLNVIYFWSSLEEPFTKIKAVLKEGGTFCIYMAHRDDLKRLKFTKDDIFNKYLIEEVIEKLKLTGFNDIIYRFDRGYLIKCRN